MRVTYDGRTDTAYIFLTDFEDAEAARQHFLVAHDVKGDFTFDFDRRGCLLGIEVKFAAGAVPAEILESAERV
jgi:uncharacterized protein YuzE